MRRHPPEDGGTADAERRMVLWLMLGLVLLLLLLLPSPLLMLLVKARHYRAA